MAEVPNLFNVEPADAGNRLDRWLAQQLPTASRTEVQRLIRNHEVLVNDKPAKSSYPLETGDRITVSFIPGETNATPQAESIPLAIIYEDADLLVIDKPSGMVVHPSAGHEQGTLVNAVLHHCPDLGLIGGERRPGIVHRLDKDTSGLILVAKNEQALRKLQDQFKSREVQKEYLALVEGVPDPARQTIDVQLGRHPVDRKRQAAFPAHLQRAGLRVREAVTEIERRAAYSVPVNDATSTGNFSLVSAWPKTGRTHQIRVHLAWIKHPIVGDPLYGLKRPRLPIPRLFLHAHRLCFRLPGSGSGLGSEVEFVSPLPKELQSVLDRLEGAT